MVTVWLRAQFQLQFWAEELYQTFKQQASPFQNSEDSMNFDLNYFRSDYYSAWIQQLDLVLLHLFSLLAII